MSGHNIEEICGKLICTWCGRNEYFHLYRCEQKHNIQQITFSEPICIQCGRNKYFSLYKCDKNHQIAILQDKFMCKKCGRKDHYQLYSCI